VTINHGDIITAQSYNDLQSAVYTVLGVGNGRSGYGKALVSAPVNVGDDIVPTHWASLKLDVLTTAHHQGILSNGNIQNLPTAGDISDIYISSDDYSLFLLAISDITTNKFLLGSGQYSDENLLTSGGASISNTRTTSWGSAAIPSVTHAFTVNFSTSEQARFFFNSGSSIRMSASFDAIDTSQDRSWHGLLSSIGLVTFDHGQTSNGVTGSSIGFYDLTLTPQTIFSVNGSGNYTISAYGSNNFEILASCNLANNTNGGATQIFFTINFNDYHVNSAHDVVQGTLVSTTTIRRASGSYVSVLAPTALNTKLLSASVPSAPTYIVSPNIVSVNEGGTVIYAVATTNVGIATLYWTNSGTTSAADFTDGVNSGTVVINNNIGSITRVLLADGLTEGTQTIIIQIREASITGPIVATAATVTVADTSTA